MTGRSVPHCPSARPEHPHAVVIGVVGGTATEPRVGFLGDALPVTDEVLAMTGPVTPTEVLRVAAPCAGSRCRHFEDATCLLATKIVRLLPVVSDDLPACPIRGSCRWFAQEGGAACRRCPQVVTENWHPSPAMAVAAHPDVTPADAARRMERSDG